MNHCVSVDTSCGALGFIRCELQVLTDWACAKIAAAGSMGDAELQAAIAAKLHGVPGIRFIDIAAHAQQLGRKGLAAMLLEHESVAAEQVPPLLPTGNRAFPHQFSTITRLALAV